MFHFQKCKILVIVVTLSQCEVVMGRMKEKGEGKGRASCMGRSISLSLAYLKETTVGERLRGEHYSIGVALRPPGLQVVAAQLHMAPALRRPLHATHIKRTQHNKMLWLLQD